MSSRDLTLAISSHSFQKEHRAFILLWIQSIWILSSCLLVSWLVISQITSCYRTVRLIFRYSKERLTYLDSISKRVGYFVFIVLLQWNYLKPFYLGFMNNLSRARKILYLHTLNIFCFKIWNTFLIKRK